MSDEFVVRADVQNLPSGSGANSTFVANEKHPGPLVRGVSDVLVHHSAEPVGFEPTVPNSRDSTLAGWCFRPLSHDSTVATRATDTRLLDPPPPRQSGGRSLTSAMSPRAARRATREHEPERRSLTSPRAHADYTVPTANRRTLGLRPPCHSSPPHVHRPDDSPRRVSTRASPVGQHQHHEEPALGEERGRDARRASRR